MKRRLRGILLVIFLSAAAAWALYYYAPGPIMETGRRVLRWYVGLQREEVQVDDHRWVYLEGGVGEVILFVHGFGADKDRWGTFLKPFSGSYRLIVPDLPGFGESSRISSANYDIPAQTGRLDRFVRKIGLTRFHLAGISMGGFIAAYYAGEYPEKVDSLALMAPAGVDSRVQSRMWRQYNREGRIGLLYRTPEQFEGFMSMVFHRPPRIPGRFRDLLVERGISNYDFFEKVLRDMDRGGLNLLEGRLSRIRARTLLIWGADDEILHVSGAQKFEEGIRDCRKVIIDNCGHVAYFERPGETIGAYRDFLQDFREVGFQGYGKQN